MLYKKSKEKKKRKSHVRHSTPFFRFFFFLSILCRQKVPDLRQHLRVSTPSIPGGCVMHLGLRSLSTQQERPPGEVRSISVPATRGQSMRSRRRRSQVSVHCVRLASRSLARSLTLTHTENSDPPRRPWVNSSRRLRRSPVNGLHHSSEGEPPNTDFMPSHLRRRSHVGFSFLRRSISCERNWNGSVNRKLQAEICMENKTIKYWKILPPSINWNYLLHVLLCWVCNCFTSSYLTLNVQDSSKSLFSPSFLLPFFFSSTNLYWFT